MYTKFILIVIFLIAVKIIYNNYKEAEELYENQEHYQLVNDYYIGEKMSRQKPILWIHTSTEINARNWTSFYSRNTTTLNQPYLQITMKSIYDKCKDSFNICLIDDDVFRRLLSWNVDLEDLADPIKSHYRHLGISMLLYQYGGLIVPQSFLCMKDLLPIYKSGLEHNTMFVVESINHGSTHNEIKYAPNPSFMGCKRKSGAMKSFAEFQEKLYLDKSSQSDFLGDTHMWLVQKDVTIIDGKMIGIKKKNGEQVTVDELLGTENIDLPHVCGIYIPQHEILKRMKYAWFARMSPSQIFDSSLILKKYMILNF